MRALAEMIGEPITRAEHVAERCADLVGKDREHFVAWYLDPGGVPIGGRYLVSLGTVSASLVHPREVFAMALKRRASSVILAHNHPSGRPVASEEDRAITRRLRAAGEILGVPLVDHVVVGALGHVSLAKECAL